MSHRFGFVQRTPSYFCHQCVQVVDVSLDESSGEVACQNCNGAFVEELGPRAQGLRRIFGDELDGEDNASDDFGDDMDEDEDGDVEMEDHVNRRHRRLGQPRELEASPADVILQGVFRSLFESIAEERESATPPVRRGMLARQQRAPPPLFAQLFGGMGNAGDYANGERQFEALLQNLFNAGGAGGPTPTAKSAIDAMPRKRLTPEDLETGEGECVVCQEDFEMGSEYVELPCKHRFHDACIKPWLEANNTCPTCRHELPTADDEEDDSTASTSSSRQQRRGDDSGRRRVSLPRLSLRRRSLSRQPIVGRGPSRRNRNRGNGTGASGASGAGAGTRTGSRHGGGIFSSFRRSSGEDGSSRFP